MGPELPQSSIRKRRSEHFELPTPKKIKKKQSTPKRNYNPELKDLDCSEPTGFDQIADNVIAQLQETPEGFKIGSWTFNHLPEGFGLENLVTITILE